MLSEERIILMTRMASYEQGEGRENVKIGNNVELGIGDEVENKLNSSVYAFGLVTIGENSVIPPDVKIGKNTAISGETAAEDYPNGILASGESIIKAGDIV